MKIQNILIIFLLLSGCHNGFCHNEIAAIGSSIPVFGFIFTWLHMQLHRNKKTIEECKEECKNRHG